ncbi:MAG: hypothetical protein V3S64_17765 [bacterium]
MLKRAEFERFGNEYPDEGIGIIRYLARKMSQELRQSNENSILLFEALVDEVRAKEVG